MGTDYPVTYIGDLEEYPLGEVMYSLAIRRETGALIVTHDRVAKRIFFASGRVILVETSLACENPLRELAHARGVALESLARAAGRKPHDLPRFVVETGLVSEGDLPALLEKAYTDRVVEAFRWREGEYLFGFEETPPETLASYKVDLDVARLVEQGIRRGSAMFHLKTWARIAQDEIYRLASSLAEATRRFAMDEPERRFLAMIDGRRSVMDLLYGTELEFDRAARLLCLLRTLDEVVLIEPEPAPAARTAAPDDIPAPARELDALLRRDAPGLLDRRPFELLQVNRLHFSEDDVRRGYYALAQKYHKADLVEALPPESRELARHLFDRASKTFEALVRWVKARAAGRHQQIEKEIGELLANDERFLRAELCYLAGSQRRAAGDHRGALDEFQKANHIFDGSCEYRTRQADAELAANAADVRAVRGVLASLQRAISFDRFFPYAHAGVARCYDRLGQFAEAAAAAERAFDLEPDRADLRDLVVRAGYRLRAHEAEQHAVTASERERLQALTKFVEDKQEQDLYGILGVTREASKLDVRRAYFALAKDFHPDTLGHLKTHPVAERAFVLINDAYDILSSDTRRRQYDRGLRAASTHKQVEQMERKKQIHRQIDRARSLVQQGQYDAAVRLLQPIAVDFPDARDVRAWLVFAEFHREAEADGQARWRAEERLQTLAGEDPADDLPPYLLARIALRYDDTRKAVTQLKKAVEINPNNIEASRELRLLAQRQHAAPKKPAPEDDDKKGLLGGIFKKK
ncbi:DnaJ domain-containing protein [bacterium]|nr:DnaJ domain-containing protein [bacterium]